METGLLSSRNVDRVVEDILDEEGMGSPSQFCRAVLRRSWVVTSKGTPGKPNVRARWVAQFKCMDGPDSGPYAPSIARETRQEVKVALQTDSLSGRGMSPRLTGFREGSTRRHTVVVGAGSIPQARSDDSENPRSQQ